MVVDEGWLMVGMGVGGRMFLLQPAHPGSVKQNPENRKMVVVV